MDMKPIHFCLLVCFAFLTACSPQAMDPAASDSPLQVSPDFQEISSQLDLDGVRVTLSSGVYEREAMEPVIAYFKHMLTVASVAGEDVGAPEEFFAQVEAFGRELGLDEIVARGESTSARAEGGYISRSVLQLEADAEGLLWDLQGEPQDMKELVSRFPSDTTLLAHGSVNAPRLFERVMDMVMELPDVPGDAREQVEALLASQEVPLNSLLQTLDSGFTFAITLDSELEWILPVPVPGGLKVPALGVVLSLQDTSGQLGPQLVSILREQSPIPLLEQEIEGRILNKSDCGTGHCRTSRSHRPSLVSESQDRRTRKCLYP
jgi:hypothetical protein